MELYVGVDVSKMSLDLHINNKDYKVENSENGIKEFIQILYGQKKEGYTIKLIICEATGGYERLLVNMFLAAKFPIHVVHAAKVRYFAKACGKFAKTDKIDAKLLSEFASVFKPSPDSISLTPELGVLRSLLLRRKQLIAEKVRENNRLDKHILAVLRGSIEKHSKWLTKEIDKVEALIRQQVQKHENIKATVKLLTSIPGIGILTAVALLTELPELGQIGSKQLAALVGVAPLNQDSGKKSGKRYTNGGRSAIRRDLYMAAIVSIRCNPDMKAFYKRLRSKGKAAKVAIIAVIRKLLILLNDVAHRKTPWENRGGVLQAIA